MNREFSPVFKKLGMATAVGGVICLLALVVHWSGLLRVAELKTLDHRFAHYASPARASRDIVLVAIDEPSLAAFGRWPWPRDRHGYIARYLKAAGARSIVFDVLFLEPDAEQEVFDRDFAADIRAAGNVFLPFLMEHPMADPLQSRSPFNSSLSAAAPAKVTTAREDTLSHQGTGLPQYQGMKPPIPALAKAARGLGFINLFSDSDGTLRHTPLAAQVQGATFLQLAAAVARELLGAESAVLTPDALRLGRVRIPLTAQREMVINWHGTLEQKTYPAYSAGAVLKSFLDVQEGRRPFLDPALFKDKIVFIGATAAGTYDLVVTPQSRFTAGVMAHMTVLDNILHNHFLRPVPYWVFVVTLVLVCLGTSWSFMLLHHQTLKISLIVVLAIGYYALAVYTFSAHGLWLELAFPEGALAAVYAVAATVEYLTEGKQRRQVRLAFDKFMSREVVDEIMRRAEAIKLGGEKREISVFFSDVAGFTSISEHLEPEALVEMLNTYLTAMTDVILSHRGNVNKYLGDGIMALFGAPEGGPNHATLACYAAMDCQRILAERREAWQAQGYPELITRIGINSGPLVVGNMGSEKRMEYTVMGDNVNLASRLEGANKFYDTRILLGPRTYELARDDIEAREVDRIRVKGKHEPVVIYELLTRKGELTPQKQQVVNSFCAGLEAYKQRDFATAKRCFGEALQDPKDGPSQVYVQRADEYLVSPPPAGWDGVHEFTSK